MRDRETELHYYPKAMLSLQGLSHVLCIAPHPDDEVLGCGGALALFARQGVQVQSVIVTSGDKALGAASAEHAAEREQESRRAAQILGSEPPQFLLFEDRALRYSSALVDALGQAMQSHLVPNLPALLLLPSLSEPHPDHQAVALAGLTAAQNWLGPLRVLYYEVGAPLHPNTYLDISTVAGTKWQAVAQFGSQLTLESYETHAKAFASLRSFGLGSGCVAAEAFFEVDLKKVKLSGPRAALPQWPWVRSRLELANASQDLPLVSVLVRSMDRSSLAETLASVAQQTYANIEVVVVNATARVHSPLSYVPAHLQLRLIDPHNPLGLDRPVAANLALEEAQGSLALFLDDDDLIAPEHLQRLVQALHEQPRATGAYSGVQVVREDGEVLREYDSPWSRQRLACINFLPIHAVLFRMDAVRERHIRFDTSLPVLEDWDFWRQLCSDRELVHCPGVTAVYRQGLGQSGLSDPANENHWKAWHLQLLLRYQSQVPLKDTVELLAWHAVELDNLGDQLSQLRWTQKALQQQLAQSHQARELLQQELENFSHQIRLVLDDKEAQLHRFAQESQQALDDKEAQLQRFAQESQQALDDKEAQVQHADLQRQKLQEMLAAMQAWRRWRWIEAIRRILGRK